MKIPREHSPSDIFVGREVELQTLAEALDSAAEGDGRIVMLSGEPGIGKTRTAEAVAETARERGFRIPLTEALHAFCEDGPKRWKDNMGRPECSFWHKLIDT